MADLFGNKPAAIDLRSLPLAERMRPAAIEEIVGQRHLLADGGALARGDAALRNMILWGPP